MPEAARWGGEGGEKKRSKKQPWERKKEGEEKERGRKSSKIRPGTDLRKREGGKKKDQKPTFYQKETTI